MWISFLVLLPAVIVAQNGEEAVENAENFRRLYGIASKIMELSGNIMNGNGGSEQEIRPRFQGVRSFTEDNSILSGGGSSSQNGIMAQMLQQYGGMLANAKFAQPTTTTTQAPAGFKAIIDSFLGTGNSRSAGGGADEYENLPPPPTPRPRPRQNLFGQFLGGGQAANSNALPSQQSSSQSAAGGNLLSLFGLMPTPAPTTTTTTEASPVQKIMNMFVPQERPQPEQSSSRGKLNFMEMFGLVKPTTTTTSAPPLRALFAPDKPYKGTAEDFDGIMNALLRTNAKPARQEPSSILSQFFGGKK
ncbi:uncharacterized protein CELE_F46C8.8 [Caenorhabditis elegans]|uniref:Uncharacterized protein n=1 Tax=Caenorhabditis elegans TaxID=6239 RepID=Q9GYP1_CAEEL|nr:Uncharacterized protein CELE_F46C8.8 [Caenorhabditis elegans]CCD71297.1 Uncharacterized protein CELE_F46C8.8 [Caenorhabditis elegans]|eukprot:NP_509278.2 Uncharacterized protein CELE_F46C8.8 [Caenorhabditis elegans]